MKTAATGDSEDSDSGQEDFECHNRAHQLLHISQYVALLVNSSGISGFVIRDYGHYQKQRLLDLIGCCKSYSYVIHKLKMIKYRMLS